jgi:hypothetical protein
MSRAWPIAMVGLAASENIERAAWMVRASFGVTLFATAIRTRWSRIVLSAATCKPDYESFLAFGVRHASTIDGCHCGNNARSPWGIQAPCYFYPTEITISGDRLVHDEKRSASRMASIREKHTAR